MAFSKLAVIGSAIIGLALSGCRTTKEPPSQPQSLAALPLTIAIAESILGELMQIGLEFQWNRIEAQLHKADNQLGETSSHEFADTATKLATQVDPKLRDDLRIKLNSLQDTLSRDYVAGSPDANQLMAIMIDKANDIRNALESQASRADDPNHANALASYSSYLLISSLSAAILTERARVAESSSAIDVSVKAKLWSAVADLGRECERHVRRLNGPIFSDYAKAKILRYEFQSVAGKVDFGFESDIRLQHCVSEPSGPWICGKPSSTVCKTELEAECVMKARAEAAANLANSGEVTAMTERARQRFFAVSLDRFADNLRAKTMRLKNPPN